MTDSLKSTLLNDVSSSDFPRYETFDFPNASKTPKEGNSGSTSKVETLLSEKYALFGKVAEEVSREVSWGNWGCWGCCSKPSYYPGITASVAVFGDRFAYARHTSQLDDTPSCVYLSDFKTEKILYSTPNDGSGDSYQSYCPYLTKNNALIVSHENKICIGEFTDFRICQIAEDTLLCYIPDFIKDFIPDSILSPSKDLITGEESKKTRFAGSVAYAVEPKNHSMVIGAKSPDKNIPTMYIFSLEKVLLLQQILLPNEEAKELLDIAISKETVFAAYSSGSKTEGEECPDYLYRYNLSENILQKRVFPSDFSIKQLASSDDCVAVVCKSALLILHPETLETIREITEHYKDFHGCFNRLHIHNGKLIGTTLSHKRLYLFDLKTGKKELIVHNVREAVAFDGDWLAVACHEDGIKILNFKTRFSFYKSTVSPVKELYFRHTSTTEFPCLVAGLFNGQVQVWSLCDQSS